MIDYGPYDISVNEQQLQDEINAHPDIVPHCTLTVVGGKVVVSAKIALSATGKTALDGGPTQVLQDPPFAGSILGDHSPLPVLNVPSVNIVNEDATVANFPQTTNKTPIFQPSVVAPGYLFYGTGNFDGVSRGDGDLIAGSWTAAGDYEITGHFNEHVYIHGGHVYAKGGGPLDYVSLTLRAPGATVTATPGNVALVPYGPGNIVTPGTTHTLDTAITALEYCPNFAPVPTPGTGHWDYSDGVLTPGTNYTIFTFPVDLARQANRYSLLGSGDVTPAAAIKGKKIFPNWEWVFTVHKETTTTDPLEMSIRLDTSRKTTI